jgi:hypothetical protein
MSKALDKLRAARAENAARQRKLREQRAQNGIVPITLWVPENAAASFKRAADVCTAYHLDDRPVEVARVVEVATGKLRGIK